MATKAKATTKTTTVSTFNMDIALPKAVGVLNVNQKGRDLQMKDDDTRYGVEVITERVCMKIRNAVTGVEVGTLMRPAGCARYEGSINGTPVTGLFSGNYMLVLWDNETLKAEGYQWTEPKNVQSLLDGEIARRAKYIRK